MDCALFPPGTVTQTIPLSGRPGIVYRRPYERWEEDGSYHQDCIVDVKSRTADELLSTIRFGIAHAASEEELDQRYSEVIAMLDNIYFVPDYIDFQWDDYRSESSNLPGFPRYHIHHPRGITVTEVVSRIKMESNVPGIGPITVIFEPNRPLAEWENAEPVFGDPNLGQISSSIQGNMRTTQ